MIKVGITGNIGSGKTTVSRVFEILGVPVFYADTEARNVMVEDAVLMAGIKDTFGNDAYFTDGSLNRKYIAGIVFNDAALLAELNALVHPATFRAFDNWLAKISPGTPYILKEAALLFESDSYKMCDETLLISAPWDLRLKRVMQRDGVTEQEVESREAKQMPEPAKAKLAGYSLKNDDTVLVIPQVLALHQQFLALAASR